jgi:long-subunit acyl-CoA synthetase (AMP-forming)
MLVAERNCALTGETREAFRSDGNFVTGDLGTRDPDDCIMIVGRGDDLVISSG